MAITYHAGRRIQGTSTDAIPLYRGETPVIDGSDTVITFLQDGKFTPTSSFDVEYLVVGGGGGSTTGGGGAGGYLANNSKNHGVTAQDYNISVGAGGTCTSLAVGNGKGGDSSFDTITATGGGSGGGSDGNQTGVNGGSGGGGHSGWNPPATTGGAGNTPSTTPSQGNNGSGGAGSTWSYAYGGAGGGSASAGSGAQPRVGGSGTQNDITGTNTYYSAGGGGASWFTAGGAGGTGGGGNAGDEDDGVGQDGQTYGSGGGASFVESGKASGKQGIVVIRFATSGNTYETSLGGRPTNVQAGSRYEETDTRKMYNFADVSTSGLKAYWKFNNSTVSNLSTSSDSLGSSADLALTGATVTASGGTSPLGYEGVFDGSDDFGKAGTSVSQFNFLHNQSALWTIAFWYKANDLTQGQFIINTSDNLKVADNIGFLLSQGANDSLGIVLGTGGGASSETNHSTSTSYVPDTTTWHFYCLTFDESLSSANLNVRRDNANLETFNKEHTNSNSNATYALHVGGMSGFTGDLNGRISELSIWNRVLTTNEQTLLYNSGTGATVDNAKGWQEIGT